MIEYKSMMKGLPVVIASEAYTSNICHRCGNKEEGKTQGCLSLLQRA